VQENTKLISGLEILESNIFFDERGYFYEKFNRNFLSEKKINIVQENISLSKKGTIRGIHWQSNEKAQDKLVTCISGQIFDVAVDLRSDSETFGHYSYQLLTGDVNKSFWIPKGFAHGFQALSEDCLISYSVTNDFSKEESQTINPLCPRLNIEWPIVDKILSFNDSQAKNFNELLDRKIFFTSETVKEG
jgi:dTDP-4-dehydrorhamnose 3,5-epimerase